MSTLPTLARRVKGRAGREARARHAALLSRREMRAEDEDLAAVISRARGTQKAALQQRGRVLLRTLGHDEPGAGADAMADALEQALVGADDARLWLALAVLTARLPLDDDVVEAGRRLRLDGPHRALSPAVARATSWLSRDRYRPIGVEVVTAAVTVDVHHTSRTELATGIQRVARETARRWDRHHDIVLVGWTDDYTALRRLDEPSKQRALGATAGTGPSAADDADTVLVPWSGSHLTLELATEEPRTARMLALARHSGNATGVIGFDCVPLTSAETTADAMGGAFARMLAGVRHMDRVATISEAAGEEYRGWRDMLAGTGLPGPTVEAVPLPVEAQEPSSAAVEAARTRFGLGSLPVVLVVGSHEPRKNHVAVLHAAETLWRAGRQFSLVFVGGNSWKGERFTSTLGALRNQGRPIDSVSALSDDLLWAAYRLAAVVLFPSLNEGFGLPVAEALASGTPVITSRHGSMAEVAEGGGALLVDPRDDGDLCRALDRVLTDPDLRRELAAQAAARPPRTWEHYAAELWSAFALGPDR